MKINGKPGYHTIESAKPTLINILNSIHNPDGSINTAYMNIYDSFRTALRLDGNTELDSSDESDELSILKCMRCVINLDGGDYIIKWVEQY